jgi:Uma2 family endonuclease
MVAIPESKKYTYEEFLELTKDIERAEFIDGEIVCLSTPTAEHQRITGRLYSKLLTFFEGKACEPFIAPLDVVLKSESDKEKRSVQPDVFVVCGDKLNDENKYEGIPALIIEVVSPSNESNDFVRKMNLYMKYGVPEYWIVIPQSKTIQVYELDNGFYEQVHIYTMDKLLKSKVFSDLSIDLKSIFE